MHLRLMRALATALFVLVAGLSLRGSATDQTAPSPAPRLSPDALVRLQNFDLRAENIALKVAALQAEFAALQAEAKTYAESLQRDGHLLQRGADGAWSYVPAPARPTTQEPKP